MSRSKEWEKLLLHLFVLISGPLLHVADACFESSKFGIREGMLESTIQLQSGEDARAPLHEVVLKYPFVELVQNIGCD